MRNLLAFSILGLLLAGCGAPSGTVPPMDAQGRYVIQMTDALAFEPKEARVPSGATVVWMNAGQEPHDVTGYYGDPFDDDVRFESPHRPAPGWSVDAGMSFNATLNEDGSWTIWCHRHHEANMKGTIQVG